MGKDPAVLFYTSDFLSSTQGLTLEEIGMLIKLLCMQHQTGHLTKKTIKIAVGEVSQDVLSFFKEDESGLLYNERMDFEKEKRRAFSESRRKNGEKAKGKKKSICKASASHMENENVNVNENVNKNENGAEDENKNKYGTFENVLLTEKEHKKLKEKYPHTYENKIDNLSYYIESKGDKYKSHYATILSWQRKEKEEEGFSSFDTDEFFKAAVERSSRQISERAKANNPINFT